MTHALYTPSLIILMFNVEALEESSHGVGSLYQLCLSKKTTPWVTVLYGLIHCTTKLGFFF